MSHPDSGKHARVSLSLVRLAKMVLSALGAVSFSGLIHLDAVGAPPGSTSPVGASAPSGEQVHLPTWMTFGGEFRTRFEYRNGIGFAESKSRDAYLLTRIRLNVAVVPTTAVRLFAQVQDARAPGIRDSSATGAFRDPVDLRQAYVRLGTLGKMEIAVTAGRQLLLFGNQRLIGPLDWTNSSRSFDAIRFEIRPHEKVKLDVVTSSVVINSPERRINHHKDGVNFHGAYASVEIGNRHSIEPFLLWRTAGDVSGEQGASGSLDRYSAGIRAVGTVLESVNYDVTVVSQWGELASQPIDAQASTVRLEYRLPLSRNLRVSAGYDFASGDEDETDGRIGWFDDMYPTAHLYYGYNDLVGWRNIRTVRFGTAIELFSGTEATVDFHRFWLDTGSDYLYDAAGRPSFRFPESAGSSLRVGDEIDFTLGYRATPTLTATGGIGRTLPGSLLAAATPGASHTFVYVSLAQAF